MAVKKATAKKTVAKKTVAKKTTTAKKSPARQTGTAKSKEKPPPVQTQNSITPASENTSPPTRVARKAVATTESAKASISRTAARRAAARAARGSSWT